MKFREKAQASLASSEVTTVSSFLIFEKCLVHIHTYTYLPTCACVQTHYSLYVSLCGTHTYTNASLIYTPIFSLTTTQRSFRASILFNGYTVFHYKNVLSII